MAVRYGLPLEVFYRLNPKKMLRYQPYMNEWIKVKHSDESTLGWINGIYVRDAIGSNFSKHYKYPGEPIAIFTDMIEHSEDEQPFTDADRFMAFAAAFNKQFGDKKDTASEEADVEDPDSPAD